MPASVWPRAREIFQEGLRLRPTKLFRAGVPNQDILNVFADNSRIPDMNWGDIKAMVAALNTCERRLHAMVEKFGQPIVTGAMTDLLDHVAERSRAALATLRDGTYRFVDYVEDEGGRRFGAVRLGAIRLIDNVPCTSSYTGRTRGSQRR